MIYPLCSCSKGQVAFICKQSCSPRTFCSHCKELHACGSEDVVPLDDVVAQNTKVSFDEKVRAARGNIACELNEAKNEIEDKEKKLLKMSLKLQETFKNILPFYLEQVKTVIERTVFIFKVNVTRVLDSRSFVTHELELLKDKFSLFDTSNWRGFESQVSNLLDGQTTVEEMLDKKVESIESEIKVLFQMLKNMNFEKMLEKTHHMTITTLGKAFDEINEDLLKEFNLENKLKSAKMQNSHIILKTKMPQREIKKPEVLLTKWSNSPITNRKIYDKTPNSSADLMGNNTEKYSTFTSCALEMTSQNPITLTNDEELETRPRIKSCTIMKEKRDSPNILQSEEEKRLDGTMKKKGPMMLGSLAQSSRVFSVSLKKDLSKDSPLLKRLSIEGPKISEPNALSQKFKYGRSESAFSLTENSENGNSKNEGDLESNDSNCSDASISEKYEEMENSFSPLRSSKPRNPKKTFQHLLLLAKSKNSNGKEQNLKTIEESKDEQFQSPCIRLDKPHLKRTSIEKFETFVKLSDDRICLVHKAGSNSCSQIKLSLGENSLSSMLWLEGIKDQQKTFICALESLDEQRADLRVISIGDPVKTLSAYERAHSGRVTAMVLIGDGFGIGKKARFASAGVDKKIKLWEIYMGNIFLMGETEGDEGMAVMLRVHQKDFSFMSAGLSRNIDFWIASGKSVSHCKRIREAHTKKINSLCLLGFDSFISTSSDLELKVWSLSSFDNTLTLRFSNPIFSVISLSPSHIAVTQNDLKMKSFKIQLWNTSGTKLQDLACHSSRISQLESIGKNCFLSMDVSQNVVVWSFTLPSDASESISTSKMFSINPSDPKKTLKPIPKVLSGQIEP